MDKVFIEGLEIDTVIGVFDWERTIRQRLFVDLELGWDIGAAAGADDLSRALDYAAVSARLRQVAEQHSFQLIETLAEKMAEVLQQEFAVPWLRLRLHKPGAVPQARTLGVEIVREKH